MESEDLNICHLFYDSKEDYLNFNYYLCIKSIINIQKPSKIYFYYNEVLYHAPH